MDDLFLADLLLAARVLIAESSRYQSAATFAA
jgi:hypothetical protein